MPLSLLRLKCYVFFCPIIILDGLKYIGVNKESDRKSGKTNQHPPEKNNNHLNICHQPKALYIWKTHEKGITFKSFRIRCSSIQSFFIYKWLKRKKFEIFLVYYKYETATEHQIITLYFDIYFVLSYNFFFRHSIARRLKLKRNKVK